MVAPRALADLRNIRDYIARHDEAAADRFIDDLTAKIFWIAETGHLGVPRDNIRPGLRAVLHRERVIYFRITDERVTVLRVLHGRQDVERQAFG